MLQLMATVKGQCDRSLTKSNTGPVPVVPPHSVSAAACMNDSTCTAHIAAMNMTSCDKDVNRASVPVDETSITR